MERLVDVGLLTQVLWYKELSWNRLERFDQGNGNTLASKAAYELLSSFEER